MASSNGWLILGYHLVLPALGALSVCLSYCSIAVTKHYDQENLSKKTTYIRASEKEKCHDHGAEKSSKQAGMELKQ